MKTITLKPVEWDKLIPFQSKLAIDIDSNVTYIKEIDTHKVRVKGGGNTYILLKNTIVGEVIND